MVITPQADTYPLKENWIVYGLDRLLKCMDRLQ